jgi:hypothetical protein
MKMKSPLARQLKTLYKKQGDLCAKILEFRKNCPHPLSALVKEYGSNTGNYDPSSDCYWITMQCLRCDHGWHAYSTEPDFDRLKMIDCMVKRDGVIRVDSGHNSDIVEFI